jgi:hypothetical protein
MKKILSWITKAWPVLLAGVKKGIVAIRAVAGKVWVKIKAAWPGWNLIKSAVVCILGIISILVIVGVFNLCDHYKWPAATVRKVTVQKATVKKVVESPTVKQTKTATAAITEQSMVKVSGTAKRTGITVKVPVSGTAKTTYIDAKTNTRVGEGSHKVTGETTVTVHDDTVTANTTINDTSQVAIVQQQTKKRNELGYFYDGDQKIEYKRIIISFEVWKVQADGYIGGELDIDDIGESKIKVGVRVRW